MRSDAENGVSLESWSDIGSSPGGLEAPSERNPPAREAQGKQSVRRSVQPPCRLFQYGKSRIASPKKAWEVCVLKAHGIKPEWVGRSNRLSPACRERLAAINLHWHDLPTRPAVGG